MKKALFAAAFALLASTQAFAIAGFGAHYVMNMGGLKSSKDNISLKDNSPLDIRLEQENASDLKGIGFKAWLDILPVVDLETTVNIAAVRYSSDLIVSALGTSDTIPLVYSPEAPYNMVFDKAGPIFGVMTIDMSVLYPFDLPIIRPYVGAGVTYMFSIPIVNAEFTQKFLDNIDPENLSGATDEMGDSLIESLKSESYDSGIGAHIMAGLRAKILFLAVYLNGKYYLGGNTNSQFTQGFVMEIGGGFAL